jgi:O-Antigen ligase
MSETTAPRLAGAWTLAVRPRRLAERVAFTGFMVLFPGFVVYHYAVATGLIPAVLGGLFGIVSLLIAAAALAMAGWLLGRDGWGGLPQAQFVLLALAYFITWSVVAYLSLEAAPFADAALAESLATIVLWLAVFFVASFVRINDGTRRLIFGAGVAAAVGVLLAAMVEHRSLLGPLILFGGEPDADQRVSTYQGVGRSVLVAALMLAALTPVYWRQLLVLACTIVLLTGLGSRAHLFTVALLFLLVLAISLLRARRRGASIVVLLVAAAGVYAGWAVFLETRAGEIVDLASSTSWGMRLEVQALALQVISDHPLLGDFGYHLRDLGPGGYAHNALSAWPQFGLIGFLLYVSLIGYFSALSLWRVLSDSASSVIWRAAMMANFAALALAITSEPVYSVLPALGWGLAINALLEERSRKVAVLYAP